MPVELSCPYCQQPFVKNWPTQLYCSRRCAKNAANFAYLHRNKAVVYAKNREYVKANIEKVREQKRLCARRYAPQQKLAKQETRLKTPWKPLLASAKYRSKRLERPYDLTDEWASQRWTGFCELSGLAFELGKTPRTPFSPSIDRVDSTKAYTQDNCRFILWCLNAFKMESTDAHLFEVARALLIA